jgi:hypothetical protein
VRFEVLTAAKLQVEFFWVMNMEAAWTSETLVYYQNSAWSHCPEELDLIGEVLFLLFARTILLEVRVKLFLITDTITGRYEPE